MSPMRRRRNCNQNENAWGRNSSFHRRLNMRSFHHPSVDLNDRNSYLRPLLPRNYRNYSNVQSHINHRRRQGNANEHAGNGSTGWRHIVWNALNNSATSLRNELVNVVTTHVVEFGVAVISAYISNFMFGS